jgi:REP element-mobilizing transposase RayT
VQLSEYGVIADNEIKNIPIIRDEIEIDCYVIMPNHIHLIACIAGADDNRPANRLEQRADCHPPLRKSIPNMVQGFKGAVTRQIGFSIWQRSYHDHIIRNEQDYACIAEYIENNPQRWEQDCFYGGAS